MERAWQIGQPYEMSKTSRAGASVIRPAVCQSGREPVAITSEPCCRNVRRIKVALLSAPGGWPEACNHRKWHYRLFPEFDGSMELGLYGVKWTSQGF